jgi:cysteine desulfurase / selenocysteine lyase
VTRINSKSSIEECRDHFPSLKRQRNGKPPVYLDNACTTLVPQQVIDSINEYYCSYPACGGRRSHHWFAQEVTARIEGIQGSRQLLAGFINAASINEILFTSNTTHAINIVALGYNFRPGDVVLLTDKEHNSNLIPWLRLQNEGRIKVGFTQANHDDGFNLPFFEQKMKEGGIRLVSMAYSSNVTGYSIPAKEIIKIAHQYGARVLLDAAQTVPHQPVDVQSLDVDFMAFSLHKMCGPRGVGVLYVKNDILSRSPSDIAANDGDILDAAILGGGTVNDATYSAYSLLTAPEKFEAGIPDYPGQIAAGVAVEYLRQFGMERIAAHEYKLNQYLTGELKNRYGNEAWLQILGPEDPTLRGGILTFEIRRPNCIGIADELSSKSNIMIRDGVFCVHSYFNNRYGEGWLHPKSHKDHRMIYRVSFYIYNTIEECRVFLETLDEILRERCYI